MPDKRNESTACPDCGAPAVPIPWPNGGDWQCGSTKHRIDMSAHRSWACKELERRRDLLAYYVVGEACCGGCNHIPRTDIDCMCAKDARDVVFPGEVDRGR